MSLTSTPVTTDTPAPTYTNGQQAICGQPNCSRLITRTDGRWIDLAGYEHCFGQGSLRHGPADHACLPCGVPFASAVEVVDHVRTAHPSASGGVLTVLGGVQEVTQPVRDPATADALLARAAGSENRAVRETAALAGMVLAAVREDRASVKTAGDETGDLAETLDGQVWSCPREGCGTAIYGPAEGGDVPKSVLISEHLEEHDRLDEAATARAAIRDANLAKARALIAAGRALEALIETSSPDLTRLYVNLHIQPRHDGDYGNPAEVDAIAAAVAGVTGTSRTMASGNIHHVATADLDGVGLEVLVRVPDPAVVEKEAELARLRAELAAARTELAAAYHPAVRAQTRAAANGDLAVYRDVAEVRQGPTAAGPGDRATGPARAMLDRRSELDEPDLDAGERAVDEVLDADERDGIRR